VIERPTFKDRQKRLVAQLKNGSPTKLNRIASIVPIQADYSTSPARALTSVVFIPGRMAQEIYQTIVEPLRAIEPDHYYYPPETMHLTVKNVRKVNDPPRFTEADIHGVDQLFKTIIPQHETFSISLEELVPFATSVALIGYPDERFQRLIQALDTGLREIGLPDDKKYVSNTLFFGNITICRFTHPPSPAFFKGVERLTYRFKAELPVQTIKLITCNAICLLETRTIWHTYTLHRTPDNNLAKPE
jgi:2'-5' RNA ligase